MLVEYSQFFVRLIPKKPNNQIGCSGRYRENHFGLVNKPVSVFCFPVINTIVITTLTKKPAHFKVIHVPNMAISEASLAIEILVMIKRGDLHNNGRLHCPTWKELYVSNV